MSALTLPSEIGAVAADSIREIVGRSVGGASVTTYAETGSPLRWSTLSDGEWDYIGVTEDGEGATLRDLVEIGLTWGAWCLQQPLLPTVLAKRHSAAARECSGPVSFAIPSSTRSDGTFYIPYGQVAGLQLAVGLGAGDDEVVGPVAVFADDFDMLAMGVHSAQRTLFSTAAAREAGVVLAAEAVGAGARLLNDGIAYVKEREQFGRPVGSYQAVKHHLANALISSELAETAVIWASRNADEAFRGALFAIDKSIAVGELVLQVHGGIGFTWEMGLHFFLRRMLSARELVSGLKMLHG
jgi:hypothetical protein